MSLAEPGRAATDIKRYMGDEKYPKTFFGKQCSPVVLSAIIVKRLIQDAARQVGEIDGVVVTVPAYFDEGRRQATAQAVEYAGVKVLDIINEPTAAALAFIYREISAPEIDLERYAGGRGRPGNRHILVYDLGGGTFDVSLLRAGGTELTVLATTGDVRLGGRDWDERIYDHLAEAFAFMYRQDPREDPMSAQQLMMHAEELKKDLSRRQKSRYAVNHAGHSLTGELTREVFEKLTAELLFRTESRIQRVMADAGFTWADIDEVLAVGGSTRMPQVLRMLERVTGKKPNCSLSPDEAVAHGAAIHAAACALSLGATDPRGEQWGEQAGKKMGAFIRGIQMTNVTSHSLGVVVHNKDGSKRVSKLIARNSAVPASAMRSYGIVKANQKSVSVEIVEGESDLPEECLPVGTVRIGELPGGLPRGSPVEVTFRYDRSGRLEAHAVHTASGKWAEATIERRQGLSREMIQINRELLGKLVVS